MDGSQIVAAVGIFGSVDCSRCKHPPTIATVSADDDGASDGKPVEREIPPTRRHESVAEPTPGTRIDVPLGVALGGALAVVGVVFTSVALRADAFGGAGMVLGLGPIVAGIVLLVMHLKKVRTVPEDPVVEPVDPLNATVTYPDDDKLAAVVRSSDAMIGKFEQVVLVTLLLSVMMIAVISTLADKLAGAHPFGHFKDDAIRGGTFAMALLGAAFAMHQGRHLSMDLISRRLRPRARLFLKVALALFTIGIVLLMVRSGFHTIIKEAEFKAEDKLITPVRLAYLVPIGGAMIIVHAALHTIIDLNYIFRRKTPPEKMRTGH